MTPHSLMNRGVLEKNSAESEIVDIFLYLLFSLIAACLGESSTRSDQQQR